MLKTKKDKNFDYSKYTPIKQQNTTYTSKLNSLIKEKKTKPFLKQIRKGKRICSNCGETETPSWRRCPRKKKLLCNACGIYIRIHGKNREKNNGIVFSKKKAKLSDDDKVCSVCNFKKSYLWRIIDEKVFCNVCFKENKKF